MDRFNKSIQVQAAVDFHREQYDIFARPVSGNELKVASSGDFAPVHYGNVKHRPAENTREGRRDRRDRERGRGEGGAEAEAAVEAVAAAEPKAAAGVEAEAAEARSARAATATATATAGATASETATATGRTAAATRTATAAASRAPRHRRRSRPRRPMCPQPPRGDLHVRRTANRSQASGQSGVLVGRRVHQRVRHQHLAQRRLHQVRRPAARRHPRQPAASP